MKSVKRQLRDEINKTSFDERIFAEIKNKAGIRTATKSEQPPASKRAGWRFATLAASVCCVFALALLVFTQFGNTGDDDVTYLTISFSSIVTQATKTASYNNDAALETAVEFTLDENYNVSSQRALSQAGAVLLVGNDYVNLYITDACEEIIRLSTSLKLIGSSVDIIVIDQDTETENLVCEELEKELTTIVGLYELNINDFDSQTSSNAEQYGVNQSEMRLMEMASTVSSAPFSETIGLSTSRLIELAYGYDVSVMNAFENNLSVMFKNSEATFDKNMNQLVEIHDKLYDLMNNPQNGENIKQEITELIANSGDFFGNNVMADIDGIDDLSVALDSDLENFILEVKKVIAAKEYWLEMLFYNIRLSVITTLFG